MRQFFKPVEIDNEIEEDFDLSSYRGNTSNEYKDVSKEIYETMKKDMDLDSQNVAYDLGTSTAVTRNDKSDTALEIKFEKVYDRYCNIKKMQSKWNELSEKLSKPAINADLLPNVLKQFQCQHAKDSNKNRIFKIKSDSWSSYPIERRIKLVAFMSLLLKQTKKLDEMPTSAQESAKNNSEMIYQQNTVPPDSHINCTLQEDHQFKYASQMEMLNVPPMHQLPSSTPNKMSLVKRVPVALTHSPIVSGNSSLNRWKETNRTKRSCAKDMTDPKWYLKYLGLGSAFDLFSDDDLEEVDGENAISKSQISNKCDEREARLCDNLNRSICGNESLIEEESQYTVSRILKICEDAEKMRHDNFSSKSASSITRRKRLYIGSVNDLFCEGNDDDEDDDVIINTQIIDTSFTGSDDTVNYDVTEAITNQNNILNSTVVGQQPCKVSELSLVKSNELFSTYNETGGNFSKANIDSVTNTSNTKQEQTTNTTPKKNNSACVSYNRSPSVLIKSTSVLTAKLDSNRENNARNTSNQSDKSPEILGKNLSILNSQIPFSEHFDDYHEFKENFSSPFATCKTSGTNQNQDEFNYDTEFSEDDMFATCKAASV